MKKFLSLIVVVLGLALMQPSVSNAEIVLSPNDISPIQIIVNGVFIKSDVQPVMDHNHLFLPIRSLSSLGLSYAWNPKTKVTTVQNNDGEYLKIAVNSKTAYKNDAPIEMEQPAQSKDGRVLVPIRFVTEALGYNVQYEDIRNFVFINSKDYKVDRSVLAGDDLLAARRAAISLPLNADFKPLSPLSSYHDYSFPFGRADFYFITDINFTFVQIKDGKAYAIGQMNLGDHLQVAGDVPPNMILDDDPIMEPYHNGNVIFILNGDGTATAAYDDENYKRIELKTKMNIYSDIIQALCDHQ